MRFDKFLINEDKRTDFLETAAMIGVICKDSTINKIDKIMLNIKSKSVEGANVKNVLDEVKKYLSGSYDWNPAGVKQIKNVDFTQEALVIDIFSIMKGMNTFMKEVGRSIVGTKPNFIHNKINDYYKIEKEILGVITGAKANTADSIISTAPVNKIFDGMRKGIQPDKDLRYIELGNGVKIIQLSLKKSDKGAQLGKITTFLKKNLDYGEEAGSAVKILTQQNDISKKLLIKTGFLSEGILDRLKNMATSVWNKITTVVKSVMSKFNKKWLSVFKKEPNNKHVKDFFNAIGSNISEGKITTQTQKIIDSISNNPLKAISAVNDTLSKLENLVYGNPTILMKVNKIKPYKKFSGDNKKGVFTLISNYLTFKTLIDMVIDERKIGETVNRLVAEMMFGGTKLPLWKVYGDYGTGHSYTYLGTIDTFMKERQSSSNIEIMGIRVNAEKDYYIISILMLDIINEKGKSYVNLRTGTNSSSRISFIFEGTSIKGPYPVDTPFSKILNPKG